MSSSATTKTSSTSNSTAPSLVPDLPASVVILCIYFACAVCLILRLRQSRFHFRVGAFLIGLCMSRVVTFALRAAWSNDSANRNLAIAATVFLNAGVVLLLIVNMQLLIRLCKTLRPELHKSSSFTQGTKAVQFFMIPILIMTIAPAIQRILTTDPVVSARDSIVIRVSSTYMAAYASLPFLLAPLVYWKISPSALSIAVRVHHRVILIVFVSALVGLEQCLRCANNFHPMTVGRWYNTRTAFHLLTPLLELLCVVPLIAIDLPHAFGDSNAAVLEAINADCGHLDDSEKDLEGKDSAVLIALQGTTTNWRANVWTRVLAYCCCHSK